MSPALWNLDRVDQRDLPLDGKFVFDGKGDSSSRRGHGVGVTLYSVDSGIVARCVTAPSRVPCDHSYCLPGR